MNAIRRQAPGRGRECRPGPFSVRGKLLRLVWGFCLCLAVCSPVRTEASAQPAQEDLPGLDRGPLPEIVWSGLRPGLELGLAPLSAKGEGDACCVFLRFAPRLFSFGLYMASADGAAHSLRGWAEKGDLLAGINAGMYLPDQLTSIGLMRTRGHVNNGRPGSRLGGFFVSDPGERGLPPADILEHDVEGWESRLNRYGQAVQNYRLINGRGRILWPEGGQAHSIAAVGKDRQGRILFILGQQPLPAATFARLLKRFPLDLGPVLYVEGGAQAGLFVRETGRGAMPSRPGASSHAQGDGVIHVWKGRLDLLRTRGNPDAPLPNIIGVRALGKR
ncbi:MAG: phosphodiester glycosidase family protein [Desulfovibrio sp.]|jgi:hypothetical protein|nr:phosphodiester glycosidase family protein [Desulfovibrio sp.]